VRVSLSYEERPLSPRQLEVLRAAAEGEYVTDTAKRLFITVTTVKHHRWWARDRLGTTTMAHAVHEAHLRGLL
jgi:two-component system response regulator DesR